MVGHVGKKRRNEHKTQRPKKKFRRSLHQREYHSDTESEQEIAHEAEQAFAAVNLLDSDDDIHNAKVDDGAPDVEGEGASSSDEEREEDESDKKISLLKKGRKAASKKSKEKPEQEDDEDDDGDEEDEDDDGEEDDDDDDDDDNDEGTSGTRTKSKRNDPTAFATSLSKILSTKLSTSKRSDPVLSRSAAAHEASKAAIDSALEAKAKRKLKEEKRTAMEKGRVRDVLLPAPAPEGREEENPMTTSEILETERKLRKIAQRGVVKLFNAVRAAQVKAAEAERATRKEGVIGTKNREERVSELTKKGFLELISSGGGKLKKGPLEEA